MANPNCRLTLLRALLILAAGFWAFSPALQGDWLMDDDFYVTQNALNHDPARLWKIWFAPGSLIEYYPLEATLQAIQWHFWHYATLGYHLTNVALHLIGAMLVWKLLSKFGLRFAWLGGLLFAIHPTAVESVAWISEFKNTLSLPPFLLAMCCWIDYEDHGRPRDYLLALALFLIAMLCKISMAPFPLIILLYAWWKRGRIGARDLLSSAPFFAVALALSVTSVLAGIWFFAAKLQPPSLPPIGGVLDRIVLTGQSLAFYFIKCLWPGRMLPVNPQWPIDPTAPLSYLPWLAFGAAACWFWLNRARWGRHALLGVGFFLLTLAPFLGYHSISFMSFTWVMDHLLYIPILGLIGLIIAILDDLDHRASLPQQRGIAIGTALVLALLSLQTFLYADKFASQEKLWSYTVQYNPNWLAYNNLGNTYFATGRVREAIDAYGQALRLNPSSPEAHNNLGLAYAHEGRLPEAIASYQLALRYGPHSALVHSNLGNALTQAGRTDEAIAHYQQALLADPKNTDARDNLKKLKAPAH